MKIITSESVFRGHPDKICDQISDGILDAILEQDKKARVAVECAIKDNLVFIFGEVTTNAKMNYHEIAKKILKEIGYDEEYSILEKISKQSSDIALGVDENINHEQGAGDQGMMYGYATEETPELMPISIMLSHEIAREMEIIRIEKYPHIFGPDGKCQVSVRYEKGTPVSLDTIIISTQTKPGISNEEIVPIIKNEVLKNIIDEVHLEEAKILINPTGAFVTGGSYADSGLTGRKIIVDTYGGVARHGGGAFSGKDPSKVDRSAAYYARFVAKSIVAADLAKQCEVCIAYSIGIAEPVTIDVNTFGTGILKDEELISIIKDCFDFRPASIIEELKLKDTKYQPLACFGHVGREDLPVLWERVEVKSDELRKAYEAKVNS